MERRTVIYKTLFQNTEGKTVYALINDDGVSTSSCTEDNPEFQAWLAEGNTPLPSDPPAPVIPASVTPRQVRLLLLQQGLLSQVEALIASSDEATKITWAYASEFKRNDPLLEALATQLGLTSQQVDQFFIAAAAI